MAKILICSTAEQDYQFTTPDLRVLILEGKNRQFRGMQRQQFVLPYGRTLIEEADWKFICEKYAHTHAIRDGLIFAEKTADKTESRARDAEQQAKTVGTKGLTVDDLKPGVTVVENPAQ